MKGNIALAINALRVAALNPYCDGLILSIALVHCEASRDPAALALAPVLEYDFLASPCLLSRDPYAYEGSRVLKRLVPDAGYAYVPP